MELTVIKIDDIALAQLSEGDFIVCPSFTGRGISLF